MMQNPASRSDESRARPLDLHAPTASKIERIALGLCWSGLLLFVISLLLPAVRVQGKGEWVAGDLGYVCLFFSLAEFPYWVPHALVIAALFIGTFAGKTAKKATGVVLALTTLTILQVCIPNVVATGFRRGLLEGFWALFTSGHGTPRLHFFGTGREAHFGSLAGVAGRSQAAWHVVRLAL